MTTYLPYRANVFCSLGHLIDGQFADTYLQQAGLIFCRGSVRLAGIVRPSVGAVVDFAYTRDNVTAARIPRRLRVLSSFADPFTNVTTVQLGCKLTLLQENREPDATATPLDSDPTLPAGWEAYIAPPIMANAVAAKCLTKLGITAAASLPLTNRFTRDNIDLSSGYVEVLGKLLESECFVGWLDENEQLQIRTLRGPDISLGPVINDTNVFTLSPIGVGSLPGEAVTVSYSPVKLRPRSFQIGVGPTLSVASGWSSSITYGFPVFYSIPYTAGGVPLTFNSSYVPVQQTESQFSGGQMVRTITTTAKPYAAVAGKYASQALSNGLSVPLSSVNSQSITTNRYDRDGRVVESTVTETASLVEFAGGLDLTFVFSPTDFVSIPDSGEVITQRTVTQYLYNGNSVRRKVDRYVNWGLQQAGQQAVNEGRAALTSSAAVSSYINSLIGPPAYVGSEVNIADTGAQTQRLPGPASLIRQAYGQADDGIEEVARLEYVLGSSNSERSVNFTLPYTGDDYLNVSAAVWTVTQGAPLARQKALNYGRVQNRLRLGNAQGVSLQLPVELLPTKPFDAIYLQAGGLTGQYRANGMSWTFDSNGIVGQVDALFWLAIGQTGTPGPIWFPMPPAVTTLPTTPGPTVNTTPAPANSATLPGGWNPAAPDLTTLFGTTLPTGVAPVFPSELDVEDGLEPYAETVDVEAIARAVFAVENFNYSLTPQSDDMDLVSRAVFEVQEVAIATAPLTAFTFTALAPDVYAPGYVPVPLTAFTLATFAPLITGSADVSIPVTPFTFTAFAPSTSPAPSPPDGNFSDVSLLLPLNGANGSTTYPDASVNNFTVTGFGNAQISTAQSKWGGSSLLLDGTGDYLSTPTSTEFAITGDWTVEFWFYPNTITGTRSLVHINAGGAQGLHIYAEGDQMLINNGLVLDYASSPLFVLSTWVFIAVRKTGSTMQIYADGTLLDTRTPQDYGTPDRCQIGRYSTGGVVSDASGYFQDVRITNGVARTIVLPTSAFPTS